LDKQKNSQNLSEYLSYEDQKNWFSKKNTLQLTNFWQQWGRKIIPNVGFICCKCKYLIILSPCSNCGSNEYYYLSSKNAWFCQNCTYGISSKRCESCGTENSLRQLKNSVVPKEWAIAEGFCYLSSEEQTKREEKRKQAREKFDVIGFFKTGCVLPFYLIIPVTVAISELILKHRPETKSEFAGIFIFTLILSFSLSFWAHKKR